MKKVLIGGIIFLVGSGIGFVAGKFVGRKQAEQRCDEELASMKQYYQDKAASDAGKVAKGLTETFLSLVEPEYTDQAVDTSNDSVGESFSMAMSRLEEEQAREPMYDYSTVTSSYAINAPEESDLKYVITPQEYENDDDFEKETLYYYSGDGILADISDEIVSIKNLVGQENIDQIGKYEPDVIHVRNTDKETDYEIVLDQRSFKEDIAGTISG